MALLTRPMRVFSMCCKMVACISTCRWADGRPSCSLLDFESQFGMGVPILVRLPTQWKAGRGFHRGVSNARESSGGLMPTHRDPSAFSFQSAGHCDNYDCDAMDEQQWPGTSHSNDITISLIPDAGANLDNWSAPAHAVRMRLCWRASTRNTEMLACVCLRARFDGRAGVLECVVSTT